MKLSSKPARVYEITADVPELGAQAGDFLVHRYNLTGDREEFQVVHLPVVGARTAGMLRQRIDGGNGFALMLDD